MSAYRKKTDQRPFEERRLSARPVHRDGPDLHKLCEVLIRLTLRDTGATRAAQLAAQAPETYRDPTLTTPAGCVRQSGVWVTGGVSLLME